MMKNIAILTGGDSAEHKISLLSANTVLKNLNPELFKGYIINLKNNRFTAHINNDRIPVKQESFTLTLRDQVISFDAVFMALHGPPAENGSIQPYFDNLNIPYSACNSPISALTFNKYNCNKKLQELGFKCAQAYLYQKGKTINVKEIINKIKLPCFVKPNGAGSSYGISKVKEVADLEKAITSALKHDKKVIIEEFINGVEISVGVYRHKEVIQVLPITEIVSENEFFDYQAKYEGGAKEITPARIKKELKTQIQKTTVDIYKKMKLKGICRIDYIIMNEIAFIIEINTIPGFSKESIIPKQLKAANLKLSEVFEICLLNTK